METPFPAACLQIHFEDFRMFSESFGMQLDDDSLLALYFVHDSEGRWVQVAASKLLPGAACMMRSKLSSAGHSFAHIAAAIMPLQLCVLRG